MRRLIVGAAMMALMLAGAGEAFAERHARQFGVGATCSGIANLQCEDGLYCAYPAGQPFPYQSGTCKVKPEICSQILQPVCGRDGQTYPNACVANSRGQSVAHAGRC